MSEDTNITSVYAQSLTPRQRKSILASYIEYIKTLSIYEHVIDTRKLRVLASSELINSVCNYPKFPWDIEEATPKDIKQYDNFINKKTVCDESYAFVNTQQTGSKYDENNLGFISTNINYDLHSDIISLPCRVEKYTVTNPSNQKLKDTKFIVDGKYRITHKYASEDTFTSDVFSDSNEEKIFYATLDMLSQFPDDISELTPNKLREIQIETLASLHISKFENVLLSTLGTVAEECNMALKDLHGKKRDTYLYHAEKKGIIPSASQFQEYLNIRNLMHHQKVSLEGMSCFNTEGLEQNQSMRKRYMTSYQKMCEKKLADRIDSYQAVIKDISPLVEDINPNLFVRANNESNSKFIARIKEFAHKNPDKKIYVQTNYRTKKDKIESIFKTLSKIAPNAEIIDRPPENNKEFMSLLRNYLYRNHYLELFQEVEHNIVRYCLLSGKNLVPTSAWLYLRNKKIITSEEAQKWTEYKKLRNDLSHKYLDENLKQQLETIKDEYYSDVCNIMNRIQKLTPNTHCIEGEIQEVIHPNGKKVIIDFSKKEVLSVTNAKGKSLLTPNSTTQSSHTTYVEEHPNDISFTLSGTEIKGIRINNISIQFDTKTLFNTDDIKMYFRSDKTNFIKGQDAVKITTDKNFNISNLTRHKKSQTVCKNETITIQGSHKINIGKNCQLEKYIWTDDKNQQQHIIFSTQNGKTTLKFSDGTVWMFDRTSNTVSHNGMVLTYKNRKKFAESYTEDPPFPPFTNSGNGR